MTKYPCIIAGTAIIIKRSSAIILTRRRKQTQKLGVDFRLFIQRNSFTRLQNPTIECGFNINLLANRVGAAFHNILGRNCASFFIIRCSSTRQIVVNNKMRRTTGLRIPERH